MFSRWRAQRAAASHLMRYWDEIVNGEGSHQSREGLDTPLQDTVQRVHERYDAQAADPVFSANLLEDLMQAYQRAEVSRMTALRQIPIPTGGTNNKHSARSIDWPERRYRVGRREALAAIGAVAVLLIGVLAGGYFWFGSDPEPPAVIPAFVAQPEDDEVTSTTLVDITFPSGDLRAEEGALFIFWGSSILPGDHKDNTTYLCEPDDFLLDYVQSGVMTVQVSEESHVLRAGQSGWQTIAAGTEAEIRPHDAWLYQLKNHDDYRGVSNQGAEEVRTLQVVWGNNPECATPSTGQTPVWAQLASWNEVDTSYPVRVVLRSMSAAPGVEFPVEGPGALSALTTEQKQLGMRQWVHVESGTLEFGYILVIPEDDSPIRTVEFSAGEVLTEDSVYVQADSRIVFMNGGEEPLAINVLDVIVGEPEASGGAPSP